MAVGYKCDSPEEGYEKAKEEGTELLDSEVQALCGMEDLASWERTETIFMLLSVSQPEKVNRSITPKPILVFEPATAPTPIDSPYSFAMCDVGSSLGNENLEVPVDPEDLSLDSAEVLSLPSQNTINDTSIDYSCNGDITDTTTEDVTGSLVESVDDGPIPEPVADIEEELEVELDDKSWQPSIPPEDQDDVYEVNGIINDRRVNGQRESLARPVEKYSPEAGSWEPEEDLDDFNPSIV
ncbi:hypothetical protein RvY_02009 [Ramazzottius varieornatus]|uniref:Uncharacterized protein n=1 Tax=Ramazzottius varieornatus TaxID=947166 RepID=A0A1D1ULN5_RAMVA|nr:hypothetical protein RvY_02009 [Ramazzottius varieornatus]